MNTVQVCVCVLLYKYMEMCVQHAEYRLQGKYTVSVCSTVREGEFVQKRVRN